MTRVLVIGGLDSSGGAGILRDVATVTRLGGQATVAVTAVTAQTDQAGFACDPVSPEVVQAQIRAAGPVDAVKIGMLCNGAITRMVVMVQLEVADRLVAGPGEDAYGLPSVKVAYHAEARKVGRVPPSVFLPRPRVDSALVEVVRRPEPAVDADPEALFEVVRAGFAHRRKMLRGALRGLVDEEGLAAAGVDPTARAEELGLDQWAAVARQAGGVRG